MLYEWYGSSVFSMIDIQIRYHQIRMKSSDEWKIASKTKYELYELIAMPFLLTNAPKYFIRLLNDFLKPFINKLEVVIFLTYFRIVRQLKSMWSFRNKCLMSFYIRRSLLILTSAQFVLIWSSFCFFWLAQMAYWLTNRRWNQTNLGQVQPLVKVDDEQKNDLARVVSLQRSTRVISHNIILNSQEENMKILI